MIPFAKEEKKVNFSVPFPFLQQGKGNSHFFRTLTINPLNVEGGDSMLARRWSVSVDSAPGIGSVAVKSGGGGVKYHSLGIIISPYTSLYPSSPAAGNGSSTFLSGTEDWYFASTARVMTPSHFLNHSPSLVPMYPFGPVAVCA